MSTKMKKYFVSAMSAYNSRKIAETGLSRRKKDIVRQNSHQKVCNDQNSAIGNNISVRSQYFHLVFPEDFIRLEIGKRCQKRNINILKEFVVSPKSSDNARKAIARCENYCARNNICWGCSIDCGKQCRWNAIPDCGKQEKWTGLANGDITQRPGTNIYPGYSYFYLYPPQSILLIDQ